LHRAIVMDLLRGSWKRPGGTTVVFEPDGTFREQASRGSYDVDAGAGLLRRTITEVNAANLATRVLQGSKTSSRLRWTSRDLITIDSEPWARESRAPDACLTCATGGRAWLGVGARANDPPIVVEVHAGSPAERAGLRVGDRIDAVNGRNIQDGDDLIRTIQALTPGTDAILTVVRDGTRIEQRVTVGRLPQ
jgi:predicted metalloprotease with PDZ domain